MTINSASCAVSFRITFSRDEVVNLFDASRNHYDAVCRHFNPLQILAAYLQNGLPLEIALDWRELDILAKICESPLCKKETAQSVFATFARLREVTKLADLEVQRAMTPVVCPSCLQVRCTCGRATP